MRRHNRNHDSVIRRHIQALAGLTFLTLFRVRGGLLFHCAGSCIALLMAAPCSCQETSSASVQPAVVVPDEGSPAKPKVEELPAINLLSAPLQKQWKAYPEDSLAGETPVWSLVKADADTVAQLVCTGKIKGFLYTAETFENFELELQWKYPDDNDGNSGILLFTRNEQRIWPTSVQIQLHQPKVGSVFPSGDAKTDNTVDAPAELARPINQWNDCKVVCQGGRISVEVNGMRVGEVTGVRPASGHIALQSEGSEVHFRQLRVRRLPASPTEAARPDPATDSDSGS